MLNFQRLGVRANTKSSSLKREQKPYTRFQVLRCGGMALLVLQCIGSFTMSESCSSSTSFCAGELSSMHAV